MSTENGAPEMRAPTSAAETRLPLAFDVNGNPLAVPAEAVAWRVRRGGGRRGRPSNVFDPETGRQLEIPIGATLDDLIATGCGTDRYLLYAVDATGRIIPGVIAMVAVPEAEVEEEPLPQISPPDQRQPSPMELALLAAVRAMSDTMCRGFEAAASGYGQVRPAPPPPVVVTQPAPSERGGGINLAQIMDLIRLALGGGGPGALAGLAGLLNPGGGLAGGVFPGGGFPGGGVPGGGLAGSGGPAPTGGTP
jgi:hypothetical protein